MKRFKSIAMAAFAVLIFVAYALPSAPASAQTSASLSIVPKKTYTIEPGKSIKDTITIRNLDDTMPLQLTLRIIDFTYSDDGGTPKLMLAQDAPQTTWSLKPFLTIPRTVSIPPKTSKTLDLGVSIPAKQGAGSYYSAILYSTGDPDGISGGNVGLSASGVTLVFTSVSGDVKEDLKLQKFGAYKVPTATDKGGYMFITGEKPKTIAYTLKNSGNVTESPVGSITLKDMFGNEQVITDVNPNKSLALIDQTRTFTACIKLQSEETKFSGGTAKSVACAEPSLWPGMYTASLDIFYGQNGNSTQEITKTAIFWYLPLWFIISVIVVLIAVAFAVWRVVRSVQGRQYANQRKKLSRRK